MPGRVAGLATAGFATFPFNPISALCLSTAICMRWTMIGHHVCHGGYNAQVLTLTVTTITSFSTACYRITLWESNHS